MSSNNSDVDDVRRSIATIQQQASDRSRRNVGILSIAAYFPKTYVCQHDLEAYDKVDAGKYTKGLMQDKMAFCTDLEDINSISMTVLKKLIDSSGVSLADIGYLEVGTETIVDKSKSVKTNLMELFAESGNTDIEGVDTTNACYGGTAALFHALDYCSSPHWDGRLAIVIAGDIAVYDKGAARPTGGCGAIAMLIGPNAAFVIDPIRASHMSNTYDFYKPDPLSEYPTVDGKLSLHAYITAVDKCYKAYRTKYLAAVASGKSNIALLDQFDAVLMHSPYGKLVRKSFARLLFNDYMAIQQASGDQTTPDCYKGLECFINAKPEETIDNRDLEKVAIALSESLYQEKTAPSLLLSNQIGNMYTASLYSCLVAYLISKPADQLAGKPVLLFSYGSGSAASMFSGRFVDDSTAVSKLVDGVRDVSKRLSDRLKVTPDEFTAHLEHRKNTFRLPSREPTGQPTAADENERQKVGPVSVNRYLYPGTYYLTSVDKMFRRKYSLYQPGVDNEANNNDASAIVMSKQQQQQVHQQERVNL